MTPGKETLQFKSKLAQSSLLHRKADEEPTELVYKADLKANFFVHQAGSANAKKGQPKAVEKVKQQQPSEDLSRQNSKLSIKSQQRSDKSSDAKEMSLLETHRSNWQKKMKQSVKAA